MIITKAERIQCGAVNAVARDHAASLVALSETAYAGGLAMLCKDIILQQRHVVLITGPSSSGKTTTSRRVTELLRRNGKRAVGISLDNFYLPHDRIPYWDNDRLNYETVDALDLEYLGKCARELREERRTQLPVYDFTKGGRQPQRVELTVDENTFLIVEGIHALNPKVTGLFEPSDTEKVYVSAHTNFVDENGEPVLNASDLRLIRRLMRDLVERGVPLAETLNIWEDVCRGELHYIRPYRTNADVHINSTHYYEPMLYKPIFLALLDRSPQEARFAPTLDRLRASLSHFDSIESWLLPQHSMLREFLPSTEIKN